MVLNLKISHKMLTARIKEVTTICAERPMVFICVKYFNEKHFPQENIT